MMEKEIRAGMLTRAAVIFFHTSESVAFCTILGVIFWEYLCIQDYPELKSTFSKALYKIILVIVFLICGFVLSAELGFILYLLLYISMSFLFDRNQNDFRRLLSLK